MNRKRKKSGLDGVFHLNLPFFFPYKEKRKENNIDKNKNKKKYKITLNFSSIYFQEHEYNSNLLSIILYNSVCLFFFFILSKQYTINILIFHYYCTRVRFFIFYFFGSGINYQSQMSL